MKSCRRGVAPVLLALHAQSIGQAFAARRRANPHHRFTWPRRDGQSLLTVARDALGLMTEERCAYCDGYPIDATGEKQVDHFRPLSYPDFYHLACAWENLFLTCMMCNKAKLHRWDEALLRPDEHDFEFGRYFEYRFDSGELRPNPAGTAQEQLRAARTIELLKLNRPGACLARQRTVVRIRAASDDLVDIDYRYLVPLCDERR